MGSNPISTKKTAREEKKYLREGLALLTQITYTTDMKERVARAMVAEKEVRFLYGLCCSGEK